MALSVCAPSFYSTDGTFEVGCLKVDEGNGRNRDEEVATLVECRVDVVAAKMGRDNLSAKSHDTKNPRKLDFVSLSVAKAGSQSGGL